MDRTFLVLGGAGLVGYQAARQIAVELEPKRIVIASRTEASVQRATARLRNEALGVEVVGEWGDVFVRDEYARRDRSGLLSDPEAHEGIFADLLGPIEPAYARSRLAQLFERYRPDVVVDSVNTATAISYQDVHTASIVAKRSIDAGPPIADEVDRWPEIEGDVESLILSQSVPQLIRHILILQRAAREAGTRLYLKVGTSGTGGMGLNIPYTHSEDRPSAKLMTKTAVAFAHTGLLFLMARTDGGPVVKEIKPAALIGYAAVAHRTIREHGRPVVRFRARRIPLEDELELAIDPASFDPLGEVEIPVVDTGENGVFTKGEFEAITSIGQMEFVTPEEIAALVVAEIRGANTGRDVIGALDGSVLGPSYRGGVLRHQALEVLRRLEAETETHSVALGQLGPPELSKLLWEAELLRVEFATLGAVRAAAPEEISTRLSGRLETLPGFRDTVTSLGIGILESDGRALLRGPRLRIPEVAGTNVVAISAVERDAWADKGWVDLRPANFARWQERFAAMHAAGPPDPTAGTDDVRLDRYPLESIEIGAVVAWVLANEHGGYRTK